MPQSLLIEVGWLEHPFILFYLQGKTAEPDIKEQPHRLSRQNEAVKQTAEIPLPTFLTDSYPLVLQPWYDPIIFLQAN